MFSNTACFASQSAGMCCAEPTGTKIPAQSCKYLMQVFTIAPKEPHPTDAEVRFPKQSSKWHHTPPAHIRRAQTNNPLSRTVGHLLQICEPYTPQMTCSTVLSLVVLSCQLPLALAALYIQPCRPLLCTHYDALPSQQVRKASQLLQRHGGWDVCLRKFVCGSLHLREAFPPYDYLSLC